MIDVWLLILTMEASKEEQQSFLQQDQDQDRRRPGYASILGQVWPYCRLLVEVAMILCIFVLSTNIAPSEEHDKLESLRKSPIPKRKPDSAPDVVLTTR